MLTREEAIIMRSFCQDLKKWKQPCLWCEALFEAINNRRYCSKKCKEQAAKYRVEFNQQEKQKRIEKESKNDTKLCNCCKQIKHVSEFYRKGIYKKTKKPKYRSECKSCHSLKAATKWSENTEFKMQRKNIAYKYNLYKNYGITESDYLLMYENQQGVCAICFGKSTLKSGRLAVDHCHKTGKIRGLLCRHCNSGLGLFRDNAENLDRAIKYLRKE